MPYLHSDLMLTPQSDSCVLKASAPSMAGYATRETHLRLGVRRSRSRDCAQVVQLLHQRVTLRDGHLLRGGRRLKGAAQGEGGREEQAGRDW